MDHDMDGKVKRSDFEISMCQVINTLWDEKESKTHINKTWDATGKKYVNKFIELQPQFDSSVSHSVCYVGDRRNKSLE